MSTDRSEIPRPQSEFDQKVRLLDEKAETAGKFFLDQFSQAHQLDPRQASVQLKHDAKPLLDALATSTQQLTPKDISRIVAAKGLNPETIDWNLVNSWPQKVFEPLYQLNEAERCSKTDPKRQLNRHSVFEKYDLKRPSDNNFSIHHLYGIDSLVSPSDPKEWGISPSTRVTLFLLARFMSSFSKTAIILKNTGGSKLAYRIEEHLTNWNCALMQNRPQPPPEQLMKELERGRYLVSPDMLPGLKNHPDTDSPSRSQTHLRGLPGHLSRQPDQPRRK